MKLKRRLFALDLTLKWARSSEILSQTEFGESTKMLRDGGLWPEWESGERQLIQERDKGPGVLLTLWIAYLAHMKPSGGGASPALHRNQLMPIISNTQGQKARRSEIQGHS